MVCIICLDVFGLIKHDRYSSKVTKPINNPDVMYATFHWLKLVRLCIAQKYLDSNPASLIARNTGSTLLTETNHPKLHRKFFQKER